MKLYVIAAAVLLAGCSIQGRLLSEGKVYQAETNRSSRSMTAIIDGETYTGSLATAQTFGFGNTFTGGKVGTVTVIGGSNRAAGTLVSPSNKVLRCEVTYTAFGAQGICQDPSGRTYDFISD